MKKIKNIALKYDQCYNKYRHTLSPKENHPIYKGWLFLSNMRIATKTPFVAEGAEGSDLGISTSVNTAEK